MKLPRSDSPGCESLWFQGVGMMPPPPRCRGPAIQNVPKRAVSNGPNTFFILFPEGGKKNTSPKIPTFSSKDVPAGCQRSGLEQRKVRLLLLSAVRETPALSDVTKGTYCIPLCERPLSDPPPIPELTLFLSPVEG